MTDLATLTARFQQEKREVTSLLDKRGVLAEWLESHEKEIASLQAEVETLERSTILLNSIGEDRQLQSQDVIEELVTRGLQQIFDDSLSFHIIQKTKANAASVEFVVRTSLADGVVVDTPVMDARGGGLAATIGFLLRVVILLLKNGQDKDNILILDETFAMVSAEYLPSLAEFLRELVDRTNLQIVMVTHQPDLAENADVVYRFTTKDGKTVAKREG